MEDIVKWCITAVCALLPAIAIYLVINVLSWKSGKKSAPRNEIAQPRQYMGFCRLHRFMECNGFVCSLYAGGNGRK